MGGCCETKMRCEQFVVSANGGNSQQLQDISHLVNTLPTFENILQAYTWMRLPAFDLELLEH